MFVQTWNKYLPVIKILLKRSVSEEQTFSMNQTDFERAAGGRKIKFTFSLLLRRGRIQNNEKPTPLAVDFMDTLLADETTNPLIRQQDFEFSMNGNFQLSIKNVTPPEEATAEPESETAETHNTNDNDNRESDDDTESK